MADSTSTIRERLSYRSTTRVSPGTSTTVNLGANYSATNSKNTEDNVGRDWKKLISSGNTVSSDLSARNWTVTKKPWYGERVVVSTSGAKEQTTYSVSGIIPYDINPFGMVNSSEFAHIYSLARNQALANYYQDCASKITAFKGMVFAGELRETLQMIRSPAQGVRKLLSSYLSNTKKYRRVPKRRRNDALRGVRSQWLEVQYGIKPLISDTNAAIKAFQKSKAVVPLFEMARGRGSASTDLGSTLDQYGVPHNCSLRLRIQRMCSEEFKVYGVVKSTGGGPSGTDIGGFRLGEFVPTLWNLLPWSFVADYFTNVGNILSSWSYRSISPSHTVGTRCQHSAAEVITERWTKSSAPSGGRKDVSSFFSPGSLSVERKAITRIDGFGTPLPGLTVTAPGTSTKWINLGALASQLADAHRAFR